MSNSNTKPLILIPTRGHNSMHRLRKDVDGELVNQIIEFLLFKTLEVISKIPLKTLVLSSDKELDFKSHSASVKYDSGESLNNAIAEGIENLEYSSFMLIMPDLPGLDNTLIGKVLHLNKLYPYVLVPTHDMGTAVAILPKEVYQKGLLGTNSASKIIEYCEVNNFPLGILETPKMKHDLDTIEDLRIWSKVLEEKIPKIKEISR